MCIYNIVVVDCGEPVSIPNGEISSVTGTGYGAIVEFSCNYGYRMRGRNHQICTYDSVWSGESPKCQCKFYFPETEERVIYSS